MVRAPPGPSADLGHSGEDARKLAGLTVTDRQSEQCHVNEGGSDSSDGRCRLALGIR